MPYTAAQKRAYYAGKRAAVRTGRPQVRGSGRYYYSKPYRAQVRGRGKYTVRKDFFSAPKAGAALGAMGGAAVGNMIAPGIGTSLGGAIGAGLGKTAGKLFKDITGWGDYSIHHNNLLYPDQAIPSFGEDSIVVKHREYICDIGASHDFENLSIPINPGLDDSFPWLTAIARNYEQYRFNGLIYQFVSTSSDAIADTTDLGLGTVCLSTDYNAADADFVNMPQALNSMFANSAKPSQNIMHAIECAPSEQANKLYYVRTGDIPSGTDIRMYDLGKFQVSTQGMPSGASYTCGQLWVSYSVTFCKSIMNNQLGYAINTDKYQFIAPGQTSSNYFGSSRTLDDYSDLGTSLTNDTLSFPETLSSGYYQLTYIARGASTLVTVPTFTYTNCSTINWADGDSQSVFTNSGQTNTFLVVIRVIRIDDRGASIVLSGGTLPASGTTGDLIITQLNGELFTTD